jgi:hypothetical protein
MPLQKEGSDRLCSVYVGRFDKKKPIQSNLRLPSPLHSKRPTSFQLCSCDLPTLTKWLSRPATIGLVLKFARKLVDMKRREGWFDQNERELIGFLVLVRGLQRTLEMHC